MSVPEDTGNRHYSTLSRLHRWVVALEDMDMLYNTVHLRNFCLRVLQEAFLCCFLYCHHNHLLLPSTEGENDLARTMRWVCHHFLLSTKAESVAIQGGRQCHAQSCVFMSDSWAG